MDPTGAPITELRTLAERSRGLLGELRQKAADASQERRAELERFGGDAANLIEQLASQIAAELSGELAAKQAAEQDAARVQLESDRQELASVREAIDAERERLEATKRGQDARAAELAAENERVLAEQSDLERSRSSQADDRTQWQAERTEWESVRDDIERELAERETALNAREAEIAERRSQQDDALRREYEQRLHQAKEACDGLRAEAERLAVELAEANGVAAASREAVGELAELRGKFDIALGDLQEHRERVAQLEDELATRPQPDGAQAAELTQLRDERDGLLTQLEAARNEPRAAEPSEEMDDLRRRFEMAVEDLRSAKSENADLQERLRAAESSASSTPAADGNDWEAQKRRLLASLEGEDEPADESRREERASIQGTIEITDGVVAEKDREIARLQEALESRGEAPAPETVVDNDAVAALLDEDEIVRAERERLAQMQGELDEKLRAAELEFSVERAKLARAQSELADQQAQVASQQTASKPGELGAKATEARRNWLNKLGLGGDGE